MVFGTSLVLLIKLITDDNTHEARQYSLKREKLYCEFKERLRHLFESKRLILWSVNSHILEQKLARKEEEWKIYRTSYQRQGVRLLGLTE